MAGRGRRGGARDPMPGHHHRLAGQAAAVEDLVPADQAPAMRGQEGGDATGEGRLQGLGVRRALTIPALGLGLVPADVDIGAGEDRHDLGQHVLQKAQGPVVHGEDVGKAAPPGLVLDPRRRPDAELGVGEQGRNRVARHLDLRNHKDVPGGGVGDDPSGLGLGVDSAIGPGPSGRRIDRVVG